MTETEKIGKEEPLDRPLTEGMFSSEYLIGYRERLSGVMLKYPTIDVFLKEKLGIDDIMREDFPDIQNITEEDVIYIPHMIKGNGNAKRKNVFTVKTAQALVDNAIGINFTHYAPK